MAFGGSQADQEVEAFVQATMPRLLATAWALTGNRADAEDLTQDALVKVVASWRRVSLSQSPMAYARAVLVNTFISGKRRRRAREVVGSGVVESHLAPHDPPQLGVEHGPLWSSVMTLPRQQRAVIVLRYFEDLADEEIARLLEVTPTTVRVTASRALAALRRQEAVVRTPQR